MRGTRWVAHVGPGGIVGVFVGEHAVEHEKLLAAIVPVRRESRAGRIAHDAGRNRHFIADPIEHHAFHTGLRRRHPPMVARATHAATRNPPGHATPSRNRYLMRTVSTSHGQPCNTPVAVEPSSSPRPWRPCVPRMIRSTPSSAAVSRISCAGLPRAT